MPGLIYSFRLRPDGKLGMPYASPALREIYGFEPSDVKDDASPVIERIPVRTTSVTFAKASRNPPAT